MENKSLKFGDKVTLNQSKKLIHGRVKYVYPCGNFADVVWESSENDWEKYPVQKKPVHRLVLGWITGQDLIDTRTEFSDF